MRRGFTLIEVLVVVAVIAMLVAILVPSLATARESGRSSACLANLRQIYTACRIYADGNRGYSPAIGQPYAALPNWALQVQAYFNKHLKAGSNLYTTQSVLVCPTIKAYYALDMQRTYAINATGHAGLAADSAGAWPKDPDNYDNAVPPNAPACIHVDGVSRASTSVLMVDSSTGAVDTDPPPNTRTASMVDFRQPDQVRGRLGMLHRNKRAFNASMLDGSAAPRRAVSNTWATPLPPFGN